MDAHRDILVAKNLVLNSVLSIRQLSVILFPFKSLENLIMHLVVSFAVILIWKQVTKSSKKEEDPLNFCSWSLSGTLAGWNKITCRHVIGGIGSGPTCLSFLSALEHSRGYIFLCNFKDAGSFQLEALFCKSIPSTIAFQPAQFWSMW